MAAVTPAPVAALTAAIKARVVLDIVKEGNFLIVPAWLVYLLDRGRSGPYDQD